MPKTCQLLDLPGGLLLYLVQFLEVEDAIALSMVCHSLHDLFRSYERSFWIQTLERTRQTRPIPCSPADDITLFDSKALRALVQHFNSLNNNWKNQTPVSVGRVRTFKIDRNLDSIAQIAGTEYVITHSVLKRRLSVYSTEYGTRLCSIDTDRRIVDLSTGWPERGTFTIALLTQNEDFLIDAYIRVLTVDYGGPNVTMNITFSAQLPQPDTKMPRAIFLNAEVVGVLYMNDDDYELGGRRAPFHVLAYHRHTNQETDITVSLGHYDGPLMGPTLWSGRTGTSFWNDHLYIHFEHDYGGAYNAWIPRNMLPYSENFHVDPQSTYTLTPSHLELSGRNQRALSEGILTMKADFGVLASTIYTFEVSDGPVMGIDFWIVDSASLARAEISGCLPSPTAYPQVMIPGTVRTMNPSNWCLYHSSNSGLYLLIALDDWEEQPKIMVVHLQLPEYRFTVHDIVTPPYVKQHQVSSFFIDERRGRLTLYVAKGRMFVIDYA